MSEAQRMATPLPSRSSWRVRLNDLFEGLTWRGVAIIALVCTIDATQDSFAAIFQLPAAKSLIVILVKSYGSIVAALLIVFGVLAALNRHATPGIRQTIAVAGAVIAASALGAILKLHWHRIPIFEVKSEAWYDQSGIVFFVFFFMRHVTLGGLFAAVYTIQVRERLRLAALQQAELDRARQHEQMDEARLQALLAQIEPHFLFNTLANVRSLYQSEPGAAATMLENLIRYLTIALPRMRESESTFGREATLAEAYLGIQQIRMGRRLTFSIDIPENLQHAPVPAMMLLTLVENAIKHGLGPLPEGGAIEIRATRIEGQLALQVADTGRGFAQELGNGAGLANIRARLATLHGAAARLRLGINTPRGVTATIILPTHQGAAA